MFAMTIDQQRSRSHADAVPALLDNLNARYGSQLVLPFERTAGDEVQCLLAEAATVVDIAVDLIRADQWSIGVGVGEVEMPLPSSVRAARGQALIAARTAVDRAKNAPAAIAVEGSEQAESALWLLGSLLHRRTPAGWEAVDSMVEGRTQAQGAARLGITPQAMNSRLLVAGWKEEKRGRILAVQLLEVAS